MNPLTAASMATAVGVARDISADVPQVLWPTDWPPPELVAWTLAEMLAETVPAAAGASPTAEPRKQAGAEA